MKELSLEELETLRKFRSLPEERRQYVLEVIRHYFGLPEEERKQYQDQILNNTD